MSDTYRRHAPGTRDDRDRDNGGPEMVAVEADIERTRADLARTVDLLAARLDVKARVRSRVSETTERATARIRSLRKRATTADGRPAPVTMAVGGGVVAGIAVLALVAIRRRSARRRRGRRWR